MINSVLELTPFIGKNIKLVEQQIISQLPVGIVFKVNYPGDEQDTSFSLNRIQVFVDDQGIISKVLRE